MITVYVVDSTGEQVGAVGGSSVSVVERNVHEALTPILFTPPTEDAWWDFSTFVWHQRPPQPSQDHEWDPITKTWFNPVTLEMAKARQWDIVRAARDFAESSTFEWNGHVLDADRTRITGAATGAFVAQASGLPYADTWTLADNTTLPVTGADMVDIGLTLLRHVSDCHARGRQLRAAIDAATSIAEVEAIQW